MKPTDTEVPLLVALERLLQQLGELPDDHSLFSNLSPQQRRDAHAMGCHLQDRLLRVLSRLVADMAEDGADLIDEGGLPRSYREGGNEA